MKIGRTTVIALPMIFFMAKAVADDANKLLQQPAKLMSFSEARSYIESLGDDPDKRFRNCCLHKNPELPSRPVRFDQDDAWFVLIDVDQEALTRAAMKGTCKTAFWGQNRDCTEDEVADELEKRRAVYQGLPGWYGKYENRFIAERNGEKLPDTRQVIGHSSSFFRRGAIVDTLLIGPIPGRLDRLVLRMNASGDEYVLFGMTSE